MHKFCNQEKRKKRKRATFSMAALLLFLLQFAFHISEAQQQKQLNISLGSSLSPTGTSSWLSNSGLFAFGFYKQGTGYAVGVFMAGVLEKTVVWTANRDDPFVPSNSTLTLTKDGKLILRAVQGKEVSVTDPSGSISSASMLDSGNFVLYNSSKQIIWQSFDNPTNTLLPGQRLTANQDLISSASETDDSRGIFRLAMQEDGHLVQYPSDSSGHQYSYWRSYTAGQGPTVSLNLEKDGLLYLSNSSTIIKNLTNGGYPTQRRIYFMKLNADGIFRLYSQPLYYRANSFIIWQSSYDRCSPKGHCGRNSFCTQQDTEIECKCLPGFDFVIQGNWRLGCERNYTVSCNGDDASANYSITPLDNTVWVDEPYSENRTETEEDCKKLCLDDCNCAAVFFKDRNCKKQRLPLRYGRRDFSDSNIALIKTRIFAVPSPPPDISTNPPKSGTKKEMRVDILIISVSLLGLAVLIFVIFGTLLYRNQSMKYKSIAGSQNGELIDNVATRTFTYVELQRATDDFKEELGRGGFGTVYKGILPDFQKAVAVKKLEKISTEGDKEFQNEIRAIGRTYHRNLVRLLGYCLEGPHRLLVYEYMGGGSLDKILFDSGNCPNWEERMDIASDVARGILYLHEECETQIIHCDIKPQNILLDEHQRARISDFGLSKLLNHDQTKTYTAVRGTKGYAAPEWYRKLPVTVKADVYSFGIVLLEIICCRKNINWDLPENEAILDEWAYTCFEAGELEKLVGDEEVDRRRLERTIKIGLWCTQDEPSLRPSMKKVLLMLEGTVDIPVPPNPTSFLSAI